MPKSKLPDRWENYSNVGEVIPGTRLITFKVPLDEHLSHRYNEELWFTPDTLIQILESKNINLGLIIDLTFTTRYYNTARFTGRDILYEKIFVPGHIIPDDNIINRFFSVIDQFLEENADNDKVIGIHCTHGVNRTGYVVCRYMIERLGVKPEEAIEAYGKARGYPIERENYLEDLKQRPKDTTDEGYSTSKNEICEASSVFDQSRKRSFPSDQEDFVQNKKQRTVFHQGFRSNGTLDNSVGYQSNRVGSHMNSYSNQLNQSSYGPNHSHRGGSQYRGGYRTRDFSYQNGSSDYRSRNEGNWSKFTPYNYQTGYDHFSSREGGKQYRNDSYQSYHMNNHSQGDRYQSNHENSRYQSYGRDYQKNQSRYSWSKKNNAESSNVHTGSPSRKRKA